MWCVLYTGEGREEKAEALIKKVLPGSLYTRCFHLVKHQTIKGRGILREVRGKYLPGYIFIETDAPQTVREILKKTPEKLLFPDDWFLSTLAREEEALFGMIVDEKGEIGISVVRTPIDPVSGKKKNEYVSGPLARVADQVIYVDRHHRYAEIGRDLIGVGKPLRLSFRFDSEQIWDDDRTGSERNEIG